MPEETERMAAVAVVGSANLDIVIEVDAVPAPGETVLGRSYAEHAGGKGRNQAVAAAAVASTAFIGAVGTDAAGDRLVADLTVHGVDVSRVIRSSLPSGRAFITLTPDAENSIVVVAGATAHLTADAVTAALRTLQPGVVAAQQEVSADAIAATAVWAATSGARFVLNASPTRPLAANVLAVSDPLIVNAGEARDLLSASGEGGEAGAIDEEAALAAHLARSCRSVIVTAGARGAYLAGGPGGTGYVPASAAHPVDTTGAGDAFAGTVAAALATGDTLMTAATKASAAAALVVSSRREDRAPIRPRSA